MSVKVVESRQGSRSQAVMRMLRAANGTPVSVRYLMAGSGLQDVVQLYNVIKGLRFNHNMVLEHVNDKVSPAYRLVSG